MPTWVIVGPFWERQQAERFEVSIERNGEIVELRSFPTLEAAEGWAEAQE